MVRLHPASGQEILLGVLGHLGIIPDVRRGIRLRGDGSSGIIVCGALEGETSDLAVTPRRGEL